MIIIFVKHYLNTEEIQLHTLPGLDHKEACWASEMASPIIRDFVEKNHAN